MKKILMISGSPKSDGNTRILLDWFEEGAKAAGAETELVNTAALKYKISGCSSCRTCQKREEYGCVIDDGAAETLRKMINADVIVFATPLYFFAASAQIKVIVDRMFSMYKWDNDAGTMETVLAGKTMVLFVSAFEEVGFDVLEKSFKLTADYSSMKFESLLVPDAGVSGEIIKIGGLREKVVALGEKIAA